MRVGFWRLDPWHNKGQSQEKFLDCADGATSLSDGQVSVATQNQAECKQAARKQASARGRTPATVCRSFSSTTESFLLLLLLQPHQNVSETQRKQVSSLVIRSLTLLLSPSSPQTTPAPHPQEILHICSHHRLLSSSAALCFCEGRLVLQQQGSVAIGQQVELSSKQHPLSNPSPHPSPN